MGGRAIAPMYDRRGNVCGRDTTHMCDRRGSVCGRATAPKCYRWNGLSGHYGWWYLTDDSLHDCVGATCRVIGDVDMGPLAIAMLENGSGFAPAMGLDGAVCRSSLD